MSGWRRYWDWWPICPECQAKKLAESGTTKWPVPEKAGGPVKPGEKCVACKRVAEDTTHAS